MAAISRLASLLDGLLNGWLGDPEFDAIVSRDLADGLHRNPSNRADWFTTAFFHHPGELRFRVEEQASGRRGLRPRGSRLDPVGAALG